MALLSEPEFKATFGPRMIRLADDAEPPVDFQAYVDSIELDDYQGRDCSDGVVTFVWRGSDGRFEHVLIDSDRPNVFMVVILDLQARVVHGHYLLDLDREYGLCD